MMSSITWKLLVRLAWRNVRRNWRHSTAALGTMAVGFVALSVFQGYLDELLRSQLESAYARNMIGEILVRKPGAGTRQARIEPSAYLLGDKELAFVDGWMASHAADVKTRVRTLLLNGTVSAGGGGARFMGVGHDVEEGVVARRHWAWNTWAGHPLRPSEPNATVLSLGLASILGCEPESRDNVMDPLTGTPLPVERPFHCKRGTVQLSVTTVDGQMNAVDADVVGLTSAAAREFDQRLLWMPLALAQAAANTKSIHSINILLTRPQDAPALRAQMQGAITAAGVNLEALDWVDTENAEMLRRGIDLLGVYRSLVVLVILAIAGASVLTSMMKTVRERTREVGTLRSLGYRSRHMLAMFGLESLVLALHSGALGLVCSLGITAAVNHLDITYKAGVLAESIPLRIGFSLGTYGLGFLFLSLVAVAAAMVAARQVANMPIATALSES